MLSKNCCSKTFCCNEVFFQDSCRGIYLRIKRQEWKWKHEERHGVLEKHFQKESEWKKLPSKVRSIKLEWCPWPNAVTVLCIQKFIIRPSLLVKFVFPIKMWRYQGEYFLSFAAFARSLFKYPYQGSDLLVIVTWSVLENKIDKRKRSILPSMLLTSNCNVSLLCDSGNFSNF